jgi:hypothetical protein
MTIGRGSAGSRPSATIPSRAGAWQRNLGAALFVPPSQFELGKDR